MVAHSKHHKPVRRKLNSRATGKAAPRLSAPPPPLPEIRPVVQEEEAPKDDEEPRPEDLAKEEEALKAEEVAAAAAAAAPEAEGIRGRERGSYDGDTAIKLYLREIGQVKLLTP